MAGFGESLTAIGSSIISSTVISSTTTSSTTLIIGAGCGVGIKGAVLTTGVITGCATGSCLGIGTVFETSCFTPSGVTHLGNSSTTSSTIVGTLTNFGATCSKVWFCGISGVTSSNQRATSSRGAIVETSGSYAQ